MHFSLKNYIGKQNLVLFTLNQKTSNIPNQQKTRIVLVKVFEDHFTVIFLLKPFFSFLFHNFK